MTSKEPYPGPKGTTTPRGLGGRRWYDQTKLQKVVMVILNIFAIFTTGGLWIFALIGAWSMGLFNKE